MVRNFIMLVMIRELNSLTGTEINVLFSTCEKVDFMVNNQNIKFKL